MDIEITEVEKLTLEQFADKHGLTMEVKERTKPDTPNSRWYASFKNSDIRYGSIGVIGAFGNGRTPNDAIEAYARRISGELLILNAFTDEVKREIPVPDF